ncbi:MAG: DUF3857 domain-containing protein, partial [Aliifodinibius sp.]|nr:DUF3857 domain-containing protein [Fodinibius sp.]NIV15084.1 DUF3857 domain-containing protein [Fodinibius sp.]NIY28930.1 DUF3857 domain-containing protein [Fodinibius sp.]
MEKLKSCIILMIIFLISALSVLPINAQQEQPELDPEVKKLIEQTPMKKNYKESGAVILLKEGRDVVNADGTTKYTGHIVGKILDKKAKTDHNQIVIGFNSYYEDISLDYARTIRADGTIQEVSKDAIQIKTSGESSRRYTDMRRLTFSLPSLKVGSVFEYQYTERQKRPIIPDEWVAGFRF